MVTPKCPPGAQEHPRDAPTRAPRRAREARMFEFTRVVRVVYVALVCSLFCLAKRIVKHVPLGAQRRQNLVETE